MLPQPDPSIMLSEFHVYLVLIVKVPDAMKPVEEKVPMVLVPEKKEGPAPKGRNVHCPDACMMLVSVCLLPAS